MSDKRPARWPSDPTLNYFLAFMSTMGFLVVCAFAAANDADDAAAWIQALATVAAVVAASVAATMALGALRNEQARDDRFEHEQRGAQASLVAVWPVAFAEPDGSGRVALQLEYGYALRNASELPIWEVDVTWSGGARDRMDDSAHVMELPPTESVHAHHGLVPPAAQATVFRSNGEPLDLMTPGLVLTPQAADHTGMGGHPSQVAIRFRDAAGRPWRRGYDGTLHAIDDGARQVL
jgi:hypothetical protein